MAFGFCLAAAGITFLYLSTARDFGAWLGWPLIFLTLILAQEPFVGLGARFYQPRELQDTALRLICNSLLLDASFGQGDDLRDAVRHFESLSTAHFLALAEKDKSDLFRTRLRFEVLEVGLSTPTKITLGIPSNV